MNESTTPASDGLDRDSFVPLYHQLYEVLRRRIDSGHFKPGDQLPTEAELAKSYDISQITIRKALNMLVDAGAIYRRKGKGTFVAHNPITSNLSHMVSIEEDLRQRGLDFQVELVQVMAVPVSANTAVALQIAANEELACIERLFVVAGEPICLEGTYLVHRYCPGILDRVAANAPLSSLLAQDYGLLAGKSDQTIRARAAGAKYAELLQIAPEDPLLFVERVVYSHRNVPFMLARVFSRGDRYALRLGSS